VQTSEKAAKVRTFYRTLDLFRRFLENVADATQRSSRYQRSSLPQVCFGFRHVLDIGENQKPREDLHKSRGRQKQQNGYEHAAKGIWRYHAHERDDRSVDFPFMFDLIMMPMAMIFVAC
jgi:hypothetical protein